MYMKKQLTFEAYLSLIEARKNKLVFYSKYWSYIDNNINDVYNKFTLNELLTAFDSKPEDIHEICINKNSYIFLVEKQEWESNYFNRKIYKIKYVLFHGGSLLDLSKAIVEELNRLKSVGCEYCYLEIPSEDNIVIQAFCQASFKLVETRLTYYSNKIQQFSVEMNNKVRLATLEDIPVIQKVSMSMRNEYDRVHSDVFFENEIADKYLGRFAEECIKGFANYVIVPDELGVPAEAFFATNYNNKDWEKLNIPIGQFALAAVQAATCKGWYGKLLAATCIHLKEKGIEGVITNTQSTNKAVIHNYEKFGFKFGHSSIIFSKPL